MVLFDMASPQRGGIGGMVGSAQQLLKECHELAALMALPEDIGNACLFIASPLAGYASGCNLLLHGGGERPAFLSAAH